MSITATFKKRFRRVAIVLVLAVMLLGFGVFYLVTYRLKSAIQYAVRTASDGQYVFDARKASVSLANKTFTLKQATLHCLDTLDADVHYEVKLKEIFFSVSSLRELLFSKKIMIDSLSVIEPEVQMHVHTAMVRQKKNSFHTANVKELLQSILNRVNAKSLTIENAAFTYGRRNGPPPFHVDHVNVSVRNFFELQESDDHILGSDNVAFSMGPQHWVLPDGQQELIFKSLSFNGKGQRFELDSCTYQRTGQGDKGDMVIQAAKFFFNSRHLPAIYMRNQLLIDTLICINPVLTIPATDKLPFTEKKSKKNNYIFDKIRIGYIDVKDGELALKSKDGRIENATAHKTNLDVYNLIFDPAKEHPVSTDSINLDLDNTTFLSRDSLFQLDIGSFSFRNNNVQFTNVVYGPAAHSRSGKGISFKAPSLIISDVSLEDLMRKQITASHAILLRPEIRFVRKTGNREQQPVSTQATLDKIDGLYKALHHISDLIHVDTFRLMDGNAAFAATGAHPLDVAVKRLNMLILLNRFFSSDSLLNIKQSIPALTVGEVAITTPKIQIAVSNYSLSGLQRSSRSADLKIALANGTKLEGKDIYWHYFDWDVFQQTRNIQVGTLQVGTLNVLVKLNSTKQATASHKDLPGIRIGTLNVGTVQVASEGKTAISLIAKDVAATGIASEGDHFNWAAAKADIHHLQLSNPEMKASVDQLDLNTEGVTRLTGLTYVSGSGKSHTKITIPEILCNARLHSTGFNDLDIASLDVYNPSVAVLAHKATNGKPLQLPASLHVRQAVIHNALLDYTRVDKDTTILRTKANLSVRALKTSGDAQTAIRYDHILLRLEETDFRKSNTGLALPAASLALKDGQLAMQQRGMSLSAAIDLAWDQASLDYEKDSTRVMVKGLSGKFSDRHFSYHKGKKLAWQELYPKVAILEGGLLYRNKKLSIEAGDLYWDPSGNNMQVSGFSMVPHRSREETFRNEKWQGDYMVIKGKTLALSGIHKEKDSLIHIRNIVLDSVRLDASRDKSMAFHHGIEKLMPGKLVRKIPLPLTVDTIQIHASDVVYHEFSVATKRWSTIPLMNINGYLANVTNRPDRTDSLKVFARCNLLDNHIRRFSYTESYHDSLSWFRAQSNLSPLLLTRFTRVSMPMAGISVTKGAADTAYAYWEGNKYAAYGTMNFYYNHLKIRVHDPKTMHAYGFLPRLKTFAANLILPNRKERSAAIFVVRDREKFIFNYLVKAQVSGVLTTVGVKRDRKYRKGYMRRQQQYSLPYRNETELRRQKKLI